MSSHFLSAISPIDGRYARHTSELSVYFSEYALIKYRLWVEVEYFIALCELPLPELEKVEKAKLDQLRKIVSAFSLEDASEIKEIEKKINHDVKAVEYYLKQHFEKLELTPYLEYVHFGLTSQDINNTALPKSVKDTVEQVYLPLIEEIVGKLESLAKSWKDIPMLSRTHGQPASPTFLGKEVFVFVERIRNQLTLMESIPFSAKFGGAVGNFNAHLAAYPKVDWREFADQFVSNKLGLKRLQATTQIEHYDHLAALFDNLKRINTILIDLNRDFWSYISMNYFKQKINKDEVGSSTMPHKVNPIDFENAEGNLGLANAQFEHLSGKLPISRLQRDLTDSTVTRNIGVPFAHTLIALKSLKKGLEKISVNPSVLEKDLENHWVVVAEGIQSVLRRAGFDQPYEALKSVTRNHSENMQQAIEDFIAQLDVPEELKSELLAIRPERYTGINPLN